MLAIDQVTKAWAVSALAEGERTDVVGDLLGLTLEPNVQIQDSKVGSCHIRPGRRPRGPELLDLVLEYQQRAGATVETGNTRIDVPGTDRSTDPGTDPTTDPMREH